MPSRSSRHHRGARCATAPELCLERGEPDVDKLYGQHPTTICLCQTADELKGDLLPSFGRDSLVFDMLGQVVIGLVPGDLLSPGETEERCAATIQIIQTRSEESDKKLRLNLFGVSKTHLASGDGSDRRIPGRLRKLIRETETELLDVSNKMRIQERKGEPADVESLAQAVLSKFHRETSRMFRPTRRTKHGEHRHVGGERPTQNALRDAQRAAAEHLLLDTRTDAVVVLGPRNRAHIFSRQGRHITSIHLKPGETERKTGQGRWKPLSAETGLGWKQTLPS